MKNFNEWWRKYSMECIWDYEDCYYDGWKAALEWAKSCSVHRLISVNEIEEELKDD